MAAFYGQVRGCRETTASRLGSKSSGIKSSAQSWDGSVITKMYLNKDGEMEVVIEISDESSFEGQSYFCGTLDELKEVLLEGRKKVR